MWLAYPFIMTVTMGAIASIPRELIEAAYIDGASWSQIIFKVILPSSKLAMVVVAMFAFMGAWREFIIASFLRVKTLAAYLFETATGVVVF